MKARPRMQKMQRMRRITMLRRALFAPVLPARAQTRGRTLKGLRQVLRLALELDLREL